MVSLPEVSLLEKNIKGSSPQREDYYIEGAERLEGNEEDVEDYDSDSLPEEEDSAEVEDQEEAQENEEKA